MHHFPERVIVWRHQMEWCIIANVHSNICGQLRPWSDCANAQSDQGLRRPLTQSFNTTIYTAAICSKDSYQIVQLRWHYWIFTDIFSHDTTLLCYQHRLRSDCTPMHLICTYLFVNIYFILFYSILFYFIYLYNISRGFTHLAKMSVYHAALVKYNVSQHIYI